ncbi:hypothetical protein TgHK011_009909 [Trichoderma gracile]|nr:hypothetical protein TgHK011_009909 [Trichoderma gracile]
MWLLQVIREEREFHSTGDDSDFKARLQGGIGGQDLLSTAQWRHQANPRLLEKRSVYAYSRFSSSCLLRYLPVATIRRCGRLTD